MWIIWVPFVVSFAFSGDTFGAMGGARGATDRVAFWEAHRVRSPTYEQLCQRCVEKDVAAHVPTADDIMQSLSETSTASSSSALKGLGTSKLHNASFTHLVELAIAADDSLTDLRGLDFEVWSAYEEDNVDDADGDSNGREEDEDEDEDEDEATSSDEESGCEGSDRGEAPLPPGHAGAFLDWPEIPLSPTVFGCDEHWSGRLSERLSERRTERMSERSSGEIEHLLLPAPAVKPLDAQNELSSCSRLLAPKRRPPQHFTAAGAEAGAAPLDDVLAVRDAAATVLTAGLGNLPALPALIAHAILELAAPIQPSLVRFANDIKLDADAFFATSLQAAHLDVSGRALCPEAADVIAWLMRRSLRASLMWGGASYARTQVAPILSLDASDNAIGARGAAAIGGALALAPSLERLCLNNCLLCSAGGTDPSGILELARSISAHPSLSDLGIAANCLAVTSHAGLRALIAALCCPSCHVRRLDLSHNGLGPTGAQLLAGLVASQPCLEALVVHHNQMTGPWGKQFQGLRSLAAALAESTTLKALDLTGNAIGAKDADAMELWAGPLPPTPATYLVAALERNASLTSIILSQNHLVGGQGERLRAAWIAGRGGANAGATSDGLRL